MRKAAVILAPGTLTLIEDAGRIGYAHLGVPRAGAFDPRSWRLANRLVGNPEASAALENLGGGLALEALRHLTIAVTGAAGTVFVDGRAHDEYGDPRPTRSQDHAGASAGGIRYYVAVGGGIDAEPVLGSRSHDTLGGLGPAPLRTSDVLYTGSSPRTDPVIDHAPVPDDTATFAMMPGPDATEHLLEQLLSRPWDLDPQSNRIGVRLSGSPSRLRSTPLRVDRWSKAPFSFRPTVCRSSWDPITPPPVAIRSSRWSPRAACPRSLSGPAVRVTLGVRVVSRECLHDRPNRHLPLGRHRRTDALPRLRRARRRPLDRVSMVWAARR